MAYGHLSPEALQGVRIPVVDVTEPGWESLLDLKDGQFFCLAQAVPHASKKIGRDLLRIINSINELIRIESPEEDRIVTNPTTAVSEGIVISDRHHPAVETNRVWLSTKHLEMIEGLIWNGYMVELLDEQGNLVRRIDGTGKQ